MDTSNKKSAKITEYDTFSSSPFRVTLSSRQWAPKEDHKVIQDKETGVLYGMYEVPKNRTVIHDGATFTKMYHGNDEIMLDVGEPSYKLLLYIQNNLKANSDTICVPMDVYLSYARYKETNRSAYYRAIEGLLRLTVIARVTGSPFCYYINPNILFNGDRTKLQNVEVKSFDDGSVSV